MLFRSRNSPPPAGCCSFSASHTATGCLASRCGRSGGGDRIHRANALLLKSEGCRRIELHHLRIHRGRTRNCTGLRQDCDFIRQQCELKNKPHRHPAAINHVAATTRREQVLQQLIQASRCALRDVRQRFDKDQLSVSRIGQRICARRDRSVIKRCLP